MTLLLLEYHAEHYLYTKHRPNYWNLAAYIQYNLDVFFVYGDKEKALHFRIQGKDDLGNA